MSLRISLLLAAAFFALTVPRINAASITVTNTADSGPGSLRQAITSASSGTNTIVFNIPGSGVQTISVKSALPTVSANTTIDGYSQPGAHTNSLANGDNAVLLIELQPGTLLSVGGLTLGNGCAVRGLVINGFYNYGIQANGDATIEGNFIGTDPSGSVGMGNNFYGVEVVSGNVRVGGSSPWQRNVISDNRSMGVYLHGPSGTNDIQGNFIGTDATGSRPLGNKLYGVTLFTYQTTPIARIGGTNSGEGNVIAFNGYGIWCVYRTNCLALGNSIFSNINSGIDLGSPPGFGNIVPDGQNTNSEPSITSAVFAAGNTTIQGTLLSQPNTAYRIEFFANDAPDPSGHGQGKTFLGFQNVTTSAGGSASFNIAFVGNYPFPSATATDASGNTSEFSPSLFPSAPQPLPGDLFVSTADQARLQWRRADGSLVRLLETGFAAQNYFPQGMCFDWNSNLCVSGGDSNTVLRFNPAGQPLGTFITGFPGYSSSINFDAAHNFYVSAGLGIFYPQLRRFNSAGALLNEFTIDSNLTAIFRAELAADQRTVFFTAYDRSLLGTDDYLGYIGRYDLVTQQQLPVFYNTITADSLDPLTTIRLLADGGALVVVNYEIRRLNAAGQVVQIYRAPGEFDWFCAVPDADGRSFWAGTNPGNQFYKFDLASGVVLGRFSAGPAAAIDSLIVRGEPSVANAGLFLGMSANGATAATGRPVSFTLTVLNARTNAATSVMITNTLPAGMTFNSATNSQGSFTQSGGIVRFNLGTLAAGASATLSVIATPTSTGDLTNRATLNANEADPSPENNAASLVTHVVANSGCSLVVTTVADSGAGSLRSAIQCANATPGLDTITFNISGSGPQVIQLASPLPEITDPLVIDGYSQSGSVMNTSATADNAVLKIELNGANAGAQAEGLVISAGNSTVRGLVIRGFGGNGIALAQNGGNRITGNFIGIDSTGTAAFANGKNGILINECIANVIGGTNVGDRNLISGNGASGVGITGDKAGYNSIQGNFIGVNKNGNQSLGNALAGVLVRGPENTIGGTNSGAGNVIAFNGRAGVEVFGSTISGGQGFAFPVYLDIYGVSALGNSIYSNTAPGIDLAPFGVTLNGPANNYRDGPNSLMNFPVILPVTPGSTTVTGTLASIASESFRVELFANPALDPSGYGQGQIFIGAGTITTDTNGLANFNIPVSPALINGQYLTATASALSEYNDTSEFSKAVRISPAADLSITLTASANPTPARQNFIYTLTVTNKGPGSASGVVVTQILPKPAQFISTTGGGSNSGNVSVTWTLGALAAGSGTNFQVTVKPTLVGDVSSTASISGIELEPTPADNTVSLVTTVTGVPRSLTVINTNSSGTGSLLAAIQDVNANGYGLDTINFNIPGSGVQTIVPASDLPMIVSPVIIDGYSQPGAQTNSLTNGDNAIILIEVRGTVPANPNSLGGVNGLKFAVGNSTVRGLSINNCTLNCLYFTPFSSAPPVTNNVVISGNFFGVRPDGVTPTTNGNYDVRIENMGSVTIGGPSPGDRNLIARACTRTPGSTGAGLYLLASGPTTIQGNYIGTDKSGQSSLANGSHGIDLANDNQGVTITSNVVAFNLGNGVIVESGTNNAVLGNAIFDNTALGIHLGSSSGPAPPPNLNDPGDLDTGANNLQNYPVLTSANSTSSNTTIQGTLNSLPNTVYRLEFFSNVQVSPSFHGQGRTFLGAKNVTTDGSGNVAFTATVNGVGSNLTATATDPFGNTSEFSEALLPPSGVFQRGDLFIAGSSGTIQWRHGDGSPVKTLNTGVPTTATALGFDASGRLLAAQGNTNVIAAFNNQGNSLGLFASNLVNRNVTPQYLAFDAAGDVFAGNSVLTATPAEVLKLSSTGSLLATYNLADDTGGMGWLDLAADQRTIYYTDNTSIKRYDTVAQTQLPDLTTTLPNYASDLRLLANGELLVALGDRVVHLDATGNVTQTFTATNEFYLTTLALDPDGVSFWSLSDGQAYLYKFAFNTPTNILRLATFVTPNISGLTVFGEPRAALSSVPRLSIAAQGTNIILSWPSSFSSYILQRSPTLTPPNWTDVPNTTNGVTLPRTNAVQFFRLRQ